MLDRGNKLEEVSEMSKNLASGDPPASYAYILLSSLLHSIRTFCVLCLYIAAFSPSLNKKSTYLQLNPISYHLILYHLIIRIKKIQMGGEKIVNDGLVEAMGTINSDSSLSIVSFVNTDFLVNPFFG